MVQRLAFLALLTIVAVPLWTMAACAEDAVTTKDADACEPDIHRLCDAYFPDEKLVAGCLVDKRSQLSVACAEALARPRDAAETGKPDDDKTETGKTETGKTETGKIETDKTGADRPETDKK